MKLTSSRDISIASIGTPISNLSQLGFGISHFHHIEWMLRNMWIIEGKIGKLITAWGLILVEPELRETRLDPEKLHEQYRPSECLSSLPGWHETSH